jgi:hypothetical protein
MIMGWTTEFDFHLTREYKKIAGWENRHSRYKVENQIQDRLEIKSSFIIRLHLYLCKIQQDIFIKKI